MESTQQPRFTLLENKLTFKSLEQGQTDGVELSKDEQEYLLPHFLMLLIGKPGSGKTTLLKQLLTNNQMYYRKFDEVLFVSPSHAKMGIPLKKENTQTQFSLDWIFSKVEAINEKQLDDVFGYKLSREHKDKMSATGKKTLASGMALHDNKSRFLLGDVFNTTPGAQAVADKGKKRAVKEERKEKESDLILQRKYEELKKLPQEQQQNTRKNVLLVLDDVVGPIKKAEYDPRLAQLVMNRRHLIFNGTLSIVIVSQKYSLIPSRVRSNASWLICYQLNPQDMDSIYKDVVLLSQSQWADLIQFVFGTQKQINEESNNDQQQVESIQEKINSKKFENLGIWIELNVYFKNFKRINI